MILKRELTGFHDDSWFFFYSYCALQRNIEMKKIRHRSISISIRIQLFLIVFCSSPSQKHCSYLTFSNSIFNSACHFWENKEIVQTIVEIFNSNSREKKYELNEKERWRSLAICKYLLSSSSIYEKSLQKMIIIWFETAQNDWKYIFYIFYSVDQYLTIVSSQCLRN